MEQQQIFANGKVTITKAQFTVENQSFAMDSITGIKIETIPPNRRLSGNIAIIGALFLFLDELFFILGLILLAVTAFLLKTTKSKYSIILSTSSGEKQALTSSDEEYIKQVFSALNEALISRQ